MTRVLQAGKKQPLSGQPRSAVVFLHGYGANGADLLGLADPLAEHMPDTLFVAPDAPEQVPGAPFGYQWFPIPWIDGSSEEEAERGLIAASEDLNAFLDALMVDEDLLPEQVVLFGFSQGTMMSCLLVGATSPSCCLAIFEIRRGAFRRASSIFKLSCSLTSRSWSAVISEISYRICTH